MIKNFQLAFILIFISSSFNGVAQDFSEYEDQLNMLPESVRSSVYERINESNLSQINNTSSVLTNKEIEKDAVKEEQENLSLIHI